MKRPKRESAPAVFLNALAIQVQSAKVLRKAGAAKCDVTGCAHKGIRQGLCIPHDNLRDRGGLRWEHGLGWIVL